MTPTLERRPIPGTPLPPLVLALAVAALGAGCGGGAKATPGGSGGSMFPGTGGVAGPMGCQVMLDTVAPSSFTNVVTDPKVTTRVRGKLTGTIGAAVTWSWSVTLPGRNIAVAYPQADDRALVDVSVTEFGVYTLEATVSDGTHDCSRAVTLSVTKPPGAAMARYRFRLRPPTGTYPAQQTTTYFVTSGTSDGTANLQLDRPTSVAFTPRRTPTGPTIAAYLRITETASGLFQEGHTTDGGGVASFNLPPAGSYDVLVVPDGPVPPPVLIRSKHADELATMSSLILDDGAAVEGRVVDAGGAPVAGARISLRAGALPSTVGVSGADGGFSLRARPGTYGATVVPGAALAGWELSVPATPGLVVPAAPAAVAGTPAAAAATVTVRLAALPTARIGLAMTGAGAGSRVLVETRAPLTAAAMLEVAGSAAPLAAAARVRVEASVNAAGDVTIDAVPRAHYRATLFTTGAAPTAASITSLDDIDATGGDVTRTMGVAQTVTIDGTLLPSGGAKDARVLALDDGARLSIAPEAAVAFVVAASAAGTFQMSVNPSRVYRLIVDPPLGGAFARLELSPVMVNAAPVTVPAQQLPRGLLYGGKIVDYLLQPQAGVAVSAHCVAGDAGCADPDRPVAETVSDRDGAYLLTLPDPSE